MQSIAVCGVSIPTVCARRKSFHTSQNGLLRVKLIRPTQSTDVDGLLY